MNILPQLRSHAWCAALAFAVIPSLPGVATAQQDIAGAEDHPLVTRYTGSFIDGYEVHDFDDFDLPLGPATKDAEGNRVPSKKETVEGRRTRILYRGPAERSTLEILRNYQSALEGAGFETLFTCSGDDCGRLFTWLLYHGEKQMKTGTTGGFDHAKDLRYLAAKLSGPEREIWVSLMIAVDTIFTKKPVTLLEIVEGEAMDTGMVTVNAEAMAKGIDATGHIAIYGVYFDTDSDQVKPESAETLTEIAKLLTARPSLNLMVVGHTDNQGSEEHNLDLSRRRAKSVVAELVGNYGASSSRLTSAGVGFYAPVASNDSAEGRAKNRRVELVKR
jgi:hypothetical protein